jgi:hypothetical protein
MASTPHAGRRGNSRIWGSAAKIRVVVLAAALAVGALALIATQAWASNGSNGNHGNGNNGNPCPPASHNPHLPPPCGYATVPPPEPTPTPSAATPEPVSEVAGVVHKGHAKVKAPPAPHHGTVIVPPTAQPKAPVVHHVAKHHYRRPVGPGFRGRSTAYVPPPAPAGNPERSTFAHRLLSPTQINLSAKNLGEDGLLVLLLAALLYLPVTIFDKATEKNHDTISRWMSRPHAALVFLMTPFRGHPVITLLAGVLLSTILYSFVEPGFPGEPGALYYAIGMLAGFALVSVVFFETWRAVLRKLEPHAHGHWVIYPPYVILAGLFVLFARLAHFIPGVVIGTVAEYEPAKPLSTRTAGIRVAVTYGALMVLGLAAWFAWIPVEHSASRAGASPLILMLDSALAITFVSALESVAFGLIPMTFLDGNDLYKWSKPLWLGMWGAALAWFTVVVLHPALGTYHGLSGSHAVWLVVLFSGLMVIAVTTWGFFRVRDARLAKAAGQGPDSMLP